MGAGSNNLMSTQTGGVGETIQAENSTQPTPEEFQANIPPVQAETPQTEVPSEVPAEQIANEEPPPVEGPLPAEEQPVTPMAPTEEPSAEEPSAEQPIVPQTPVETETDVINRLGLEDVEPAFGSDVTQTPTLNIPETTPDGVPVAAIEIPKEEKEKPIIEEDEEGGVIEEPIIPTETPDGIPVGGIEVKPKINLADVNAKYKNEGIQIDDLGKVTVGVEEKKDAQGLPDGSYRLAGKSANYQKIDGKWYKDANLTGDYQPIGGDNVDSRIGYLEANAQATVSETQKKANEIINQRFGDMRKEVEGNRVAENNFTFDDFTKGKSTDNTQKYNTDGTVNFNYDPNAAKTKETFGVSTTKRELPEGIYKYPGSNASYKRVDGDWLIDPKGGTDFVPMTKGNVAYRKSKLDTDAMLQAKPDGVYIYPGSKASYKRVNGDWLIDPAGGSNYVQMTQGDVAKRKAQLDLSAVKAVKAGEYNDLGAIIKKQGIGSAPAGIPSLTPSVEQSMLEKAAKVSDEKKAAFNKANNFANTDVMSQLTVKAADGSPIQILNPSQMTSFLEHQNKIKDIIGDGSYSVAKAAKVEQAMKEAETYFNECKQINAEINKARAENKSLSRVSFEKKMELADDLITDSDEATMFATTANMADFVLDNVDNGKMRFDAEAGQYVISPNVKGTERQYLESKLAEYVDYYTSLQGEKYAEAQAKIQDERQKLSATKRNIVKLESSLAEMKRNGVDEKSAEYQSVATELQKSKQQADDYDALIDKKIYATDAAFLTEPKKTAQTLALSLSQNAYDIVAAIPKDITPKQQFDLIYERLAAENDRLAKQYGLNTEGLGNANMKVKDMVDWDGFYALSKEEKQWLQNKATLTKMAPLYFNNSDMLSNEGTGFWESFTNSFYSTLFPNTAKAEGFTNLSEASGATAQKLQEFGFKEDDYVTPEMAKKLEEQSKVDFWSMEKWGGMVGTTAAIVAPLMITAGVPSTALRVVKGVEGLITGANVTKTAKLVSTAERIYNSALQSTRFGRFLKPTIESAVKAEIAGDIFTSQEDELNFLSFMAGGVVSESLGVFFSKMPKDQVYKYLQGVFGNKVNAAINVIKKGGEATARGIGETGEETMQELVGIYQRTDSWAEMKNELSKQFGTFDQVQEFLISSFIMGAGFGLTESKGAKEAYEKLPPKSKEQVDAAIEAIRADLNEADSKVEEFAENKEKQQKVEQTIEENDKKDEEGVSGQVGEGQESVEGQPVSEPSQEAPSTGGVVQEEQGQTEQVAPAEETPAEAPKPQKATARSLEEAQELVKQGYVPADKSLSPKALENIFNTRKKLNMVKVEQTPAAETTTEAPAAESTTSAPTAETTVTETPTSTGTAETPVAETATESTSKKRKIKDEEVGIAIHGTPDGRKDLANSNFKGEAPDIRMPFVRVETEGGKNSVDIPFDEKGFAVDDTKENENIIHFKLGALEKSRGGQGGRSGYIGGSISVPKGTDIDAAKKDIEAVLNDFNNKYNEGSKYEVRFDAIPDAAYNQMQEDIRKRLLENTSVDETKMTAPVTETQTETTAEPVVEGRTISQIAKDFANKIRAAKLSDGGLKSSLPGLDAAFKGSLEVVARVIETAGMSAETIQKAIEAGFQVVKQSQWFNDLSKNQKRQAEADYKQGMNDMLNEGKMTSAEKAAAKEFGKKVAKATGTAKQPKTVQMTESQAIRERMRISGQTAKQLRDIRRQILDYAKANLPKSEYTNLEINRITAALKAKDLETALDKIDAIIAKKQEGIAKRDAKTAERKRKATIKDIKDKMKSKRTLLSLQGGRWVGKTTVEAQKEYLKFINNVKIDELDGKTQEELDEINDIIDGIVSEGKADYKRLKELDNDAKRERAAALIQGLARGQGAELNSVEEIMDFFDKGGQVVIDGRLYNESSFKQLINKDTQKGKQGEKIEDIKEEIEELKKDYENRLEEVIVNGGTESTDPDLKAITKKINAKNKQLSTNEEKYNSMPDADVEMTSAVGYKQENAELAKLNERAKSKKLINRVINFLTPTKAINDLYSLYTKTWSKSPAVARFVRDNIMEPVKKAYIARDIAYSKKVNEYYEKLDEIFGTYPAKKVKERAGVAKRGSKAIDKLSESVDGIVTSEVAKGANITNGHVIDYYNLAQTKDGVKRLTNSGVDVDAVIAHVEGDAQLKKYADFLMEKYKELGIEYEPTYIAYTGTPFPSGDFPYYPANASDYSQDFVNEGDLMGDNGSFNMMNATSNNMKAKKNYQGNFNIAMDAHAKYLDYVKNMEHAKHFMPIAKKVNELFSKINAPHLIKNLGIDDYNDIKTHTARVLSNQGISAPSSSVRNILMGIRNYTVVTTLGFKPSSLAKQFVGFTHYWVAGIDKGLDPLQIWKGAPVNKNELELAREIIGSDYVKERLTGQHIDVEMKRLMEQAQNSTSAKVWSKFSQAAMAPVRYGDKFALLYGPGGGLFFATASYRHALSEGMNHEEAKAYALEQFITETELSQQSTRADLTSNIQLDETFRMLGMYRTGQMAAAKKVVTGMRLIYQANRMQKEEGVEARRDAISDRDIVKASVDITYYTLAASLLFSVIANGAISVFMGDDDEAKKRALHDTAMDSIGSMFQGYGMPGFVIDGFLNHMRDDDWKDNVPILKTLIGLWETTPIMYDAANRDWWGNMTTAQRKDFLEREGEKTFDSGENVDRYAEQFNDRFWINKTTEKEYDDITKAVGLKNVSDLVSNIGEWMDGAKDFTNAIMNWDMDYMEKNRERGKNDRIFEMFYGIPYIEKNGEPSFTPADEDKEPDMFTEDESGISAEEGDVTRPKSRFRRNF